VSIEGLEGTQFADTLIGDDNSNFLRGGGGLDTLTGGAGGDAFVFDRSLVAGNIITITDYAPGTDVFRLSTSIFTAAGPPNTVLSAGAFFIGSAAHDTDDRIIYNSADGTLLYDADGTGAQAAASFAVVSTGLSLTQNDFLLI
jgi:Ca2+-binding RTX toxin-like protein